MKSVDVAPETKQAQESPVVEKAKKVKAAKPAQPETPSKVIFQNRQCPGDILMMTAAIRDFKKAFPAVEVSVNTRCGYLWDNNPNITKASKDAKLIQLNYKTPHQSGKTPTTEHFIYAFHKSIEQQLNVKIPRGIPYPDIYLSDFDKKPLISSNKPIMLINAGSKADFPIKQWPIEYFQRLVDECRDHYTVVQIGETVTGKHPALTGVITMLNNTPDRQIVRLMHQAAVVVTGVSFPMHLCAALNAADGGSRKCIVLAGHREDVAWEKYPDTYYLQKPCKCVAGECGCWKRNLPNGAQPDPEACTNAVRLFNGHYYAGCLADVRVADVLKCLE